MFTKVIFVFARNLPFRNTSPGPSSTGKGLPGNPLRSSGKCKALTKFIGGFIVALTVGHTVAAQQPPPLLNEEKKMEVRARGTSGEEQIRLLVGEQVVATWQLGTSLQSYHATTARHGTVRVEFFNDEPGRDVRVDFLSVDGVVYQAEDQSVNTGAFQNGKCGGGKGRTEWMRCNGYVDFNM